MALTPTLRTREDFIALLSQCGTLSYLEMINLLYSILFYYEGGGGGGTAPLPYDQTNLIYTASGGGHVYLPLSMTGTRFPIGMKVTNTATNEVRVVFPAYIDGTTDPEGIWDQFFIDGSGNPVAQTVLLYYVGTF